MSARSAAKGYRITGPDRARVLDLLHLHCEVAGVHEVEDGIHVWLRSELPAAASPSGRLAASIETLPAEARTWTGLEEDRPVRVGRDILVRPPWVPGPADFHGVELVVPRGSAFGSGEHGSTRAALAALERLWPEGLRSLADVGTGSGILALYAAQRGCPLVMACDVDPACVKAARELLPGALVVQGGPDALPGAADAVVANLSGAELLAAVDELIGVWTRRGPLVLSGLLENEVGDLVARVPYEPEIRLREDEFVALGWPSPFSRTAGGP